MYRIPRLVERLSIKSELLMSSEESTWMPMVIWYSESTGGIVGLVVVEDAVDILGVTTSEDEVTRGVDSSRIELDI